MRNTVSDRGALVFIHHPTHPLTPSQERALERHAKRLGYSSLIAMPDNQRGDLHRVPGIVVGPSVTFASFIPSLHQEVPS